MNIFYLHHLPAIAARMHCDKHVVKMIVESCQMLATAHHVHGNGHNVTYKQAHLNHPSTVWVRQSGEHYRWLRDLTRNLCDEFTNRYGKVHACEQILVNELWNPPSAIADSNKWSNPPQCMPDEYKHYDTVMAYRRYYMSKDSSWARTYYKGAGARPNWMEYDYV
jgi:hypothetical protein